MSSQYQIQDNFLFYSVQGSHRRKHCPSSLYLLCVPRRLNIWKLGPVVRSDLKGANLNSLAQETEVGLVWFGLVSYAWTLCMYPAARTYQNSRLRATLALEEKSPHPGYICTKNIGNILWRFLQICYIKIFPDHSSFSSFYINNVIISLLCHFMAMMSFQYKWSKTFSKAA